MSDASFGRLRQLVTDQVPVVMTTIVEGEGLGTRMIVTFDDVEGSLGNPKLDAQVVQDARATLDAEVSVTRQYGEQRVFLDVYPLPPELILFGAVHLSQALSRFAQALGFRVTIVDARRALATRERFPNVERIIMKWPEEAFGELEIGRNTWIAILTHDSKFDEPAIMGALKTPARYVGAIGSRKVNAERREWLRQEGVREEDIARLRAPIGLDLGGQAPEEMAIAILGEILALRNQREGGFLVHGSGNIRGVPE
ncbi:MAG TPA: XdhC/CoxI family protein [Thermomicrobiales bacterium]|nr:XdhC/CoxI family protein [Thermomicrobiales bacterium]